jgi:hypothetical protein
VCVPMNNSCPIPLVIATGQGLQLAPAELFDRSFHIR